MRLLEIRTLGTKSPEQSSDPKWAQYIQEKLLSHKKARLIEDKMSYEELAVIENFSEDEVTFALNRQIIKERKDKAAL